MVHEFDVGAARTRRDGHPERVADQRGAHMRRELPADHAPAVDVDDEGQEDQALPAAQVGEVGHVELVRPAGGEVALDEIRAPGGVRVGRGRLPARAAALGALDAVSAHQPLDAVTTDLDSPPSQREVQLAVAVGLEVLGVQRADRRDELLVGDRAGRPPAGGALVVRRARHPERAADELDGEAGGLLRLDEGAHLRGVPSSSLAKNTDAALRISLA